MRLINCLSILFGFLTVHIEHEQLQSGYPLDLLAAFIRMSNMAKYYEITALIDFDYQESFFGSYELSETRAELEEIKDALKRDGYRNIKITPRDCPESPTYKRTLLKNLKHGAAFKRKLEAISIYSRGQYNRADAWNRTATYTCGNIITGREIFLTGTTLIYLMEV